MTTVRLDLHDGLATVTLDRPHRLNAINGALVADLRRALTEAMRAPEVRAVILTGAGDRAFCAGDDLQEPVAGSEADIRRLIGDIQDVTRLIMFEPKPVVAAVNGWAVGGGFEWVTNCDFSIWADTARGFLPEVTLGLGVTGAVTAILPRLVGWHRARALFFLGEQQSAAELHALGIAHAVVPAAQVMAESERLARRLMAAPAGALGGLKRALAVVNRDELERAMAAETETLVRLFQDPETRRRAAEFGSRRRPSAGPASEAR